MNIFLDNDDNYKREIDIIKAYATQSSSYLQKIKNISKDSADKIMVDIIKTKLLDRKIKHFSRKENGDREIIETSLLGYIYNNIKNNNIIVPTFTTYLNSNVKKSMLSEFIANNVKVRSIAKKIAQKAKVNKNMDLYNSKNNEQSMLKTYNNSLSGAFAQKSCILHNPTAHSTLTSITRTMSSLANANNEKLITGNRFYYSPLIMLNNIIYIVSNANLIILKDVIDKYNLYLPNVDDVVNVLKRSSDLYFSDLPYYLTKIIPYLNTLTSYERAAICYLGDFYHIRVFNPEFVKTFITELCTKISSNDTSLDIPNKLYATNESILNFTHLIWFSMVRGYGKKYEELHTENKAANLYYTTLHIEEVLVKYKDFIHGFFVTNILPNSSNRLKYMRRRTVVLSDTDSTCFTMEEWVNWYNGSIVINDETIAVAGAVCLLATENIAHLLAKLSANLNVDKSLLHTLAMKNEYMWTVHIPTEVSKHYLAYTVMQEGSVHSEPELEIKGVHLKNNALPKNIKDDINNLIEDILKTIHTNNKIKITNILLHIKNLEDEIRRSVLAGEVIYYKKSSIKNKEGYAMDEFHSPYQRHMFWVDIFQDKYGEVAEPPYNTIKIPTIIINKVTMNEWINSIEDKDIADKLNTWLIKYNKKDLPTLYLNVDYAQAYGIPIEFINIIDVKRIILDLTITYRLILESLGLIMDNKLLISEQYLF